MARRRRLGRGDLEPLSPSGSPEVLGWDWSETPGPGPLLPDAQGRAGNAQVEAP